MASLRTHGGGWGKAKRDKCDKSGALQGGTVRVRASRSWARPAPRSEFFYLLGRAANRPPSLRHSPPKMLPQGPYNTAQAPRHITAKLTYPRGCQEGLSQELQY